MDFSKKIQSEKNHISALEAKIKDAQTQLKLHKENLKELELKEITQFLSNNKISHNEVMSQLHKLQERLQERKNDEGDVSG